MIAVDSRNAKDPFTATGAGERQAAYAALAAAGPVHRVTLPTGDPAWLVIGYDVARQALHDRRLVKSEQVLTNVGSGVVPSELLSAVTSHMLNNNPPDHTRLRRLVAGASAIGLGSAIYRPSRKNRLFLEALPGAKLQRSRAIQVSITTIRRKSTTPGSLVTVEGAGVMAGPTSWADRPCAVRAHRRPACSNNPAAVARELATAGCRLARRS